MSRSTGHSDGTIFSRPYVPCVKLLIVLQCRQLFLKGPKDVGTLLWDIFSSVPMSLAPLCCIYRDKFLLLGNAKNLFLTGTHVCVPLEETSSCGTLLRECS